MTVHKAQGSEFEDVLVILPDRPGRVLSRELLYTAVTRAAKTCILVGDRWGLHHAVGKNATVKRRTFLSRWAAQGGPALT